MFLPKSLFSSLEGLPGYDEAAFASVHSSGGQVTSIRINPARNLQPRFDTQSEPVPWAAQGYYLAERPSFTFDPQFHAGAYYVQEASSMLIEQAFLQHVQIDQHIRVLDLCAAPGGKSTHLQSLLANRGLLVSNEVIRSRASILRDNVIKWGAQNVVVTNNDPADFQKLPGFFDCILIDAPCSGSGLFRRDPEAVNEWSPEQVLFCAARQKRILADALPALKEGGILLYSTCSYSKEEDEEMLQFLAENGEYESLQVQLPAAWNIIETEQGGLYGYRCWPHLIKGEGFFLAVFRKKGSAQAGSRDKLRKSLQTVSRQEREWIQPWLPNKEEYEFFKNENTVFAWPAEQLTDMQLVFEKMQVIYAGVRAGELTRNKMVPDHALAMLPQETPAIEATTLTYENAIAYLQRKDLNASLFHNKGWQLVDYNGFVLGWVNVLPNRVNNYYPKELRILKEK